MFPQHPCAVFRMYVFFMLVFLHFLPLKFGGESKRTGQTRASDLCPVNYRRSREVWRGRQNGRAIIVPNAVCPMFKRGTEEAVFKFK